MNFSNNPPYKNKNLYGLSDDKIAEFTPDSDRSKARPNGNT